MYEELGAIARDLVADLERARPGFPPDEAGFRAAAEQRVRLRLGDLRPQYVALGTAEGFARIEQEVATVLLPRYLAIALPYDRVEKKGIGWRGGDVVARLVLGLTGLAVGGLLVWAPFIPIWEKWIPFAMMAAAPFIPDLQRAWLVRRYERRLAELTDAMEEAGSALVATEPIDLATPADRALAELDRSIEAGDRPTEAGSSLVTDQARTTQSNKSDDDAAAEAVPVGAGSSDRGQRGA